MDQSKVRRLLALVLGIGNYINGDTARGQAYGVKIDIFAKIVNLKAALPSQGSLMNFVALIAEQQAPETTSLSESWMGIWAAAEINFKQLTTDINQLDAQLNKVDQEYLKAKEDAASTSLARRLDSILKANKPVLEDMKKSIKSAEQGVEKVMQRYGESLRGANAEEDSCKKFFSTIADFAKSFRAALDENVARRAEIEKAQRALAEADTSGKEDKKSGGSSAASAQGKKPQENLFGRFHDAQKASAGDVLAEFKLKMASKAGRAV